MALLIFNDYLAIPLYTICVYFENLKEIIAVLRNLSSQAAKTTQLKRVKQEENNYTKHLRMLVPKLGTKIVLTFEYNNRETHIIALQMKECIPMREKKKSYS